MQDVIEIPLSQLPKYGLRLASQSATALHRFPDPSPADPKPPVAACALSGGGDGCHSDDPDDYVRTRISLAVDARRYSLCSCPYCFGRFTAVRDDEWDGAALFDRSAKLDSPLAD
jgi:hypothetical protein